MSRQGDNNHSVQDGDANASGSSSPRGEINRTRGSISLGDLRTELEARLLEVDAWLVGLADSGIVLGMPFEGTQQNHILPLRGAVISGEIDIITSAFTRVERPAEASGSSSPVVNGHSSPRLIDGPIPSINRSSSPSVSSAPSTGGSQQNGTERPDGSIDREGRDNAPDDGERSRQWE
jgi:hypothetical protein